jgi:hypothetical protein
MAESSEWFTVNITVHSVGPEHKNYTDSGMPWIADRDTYRSVFSFQFREDAKKFYERYGGARSWYGEEKDG